MRLVPAALLALALLLTGCSSSSSDKETDAGASTGAAPERVGVGDITFALPDGWTDLDSEEMVEGVEDEDGLRSYQENMGMTDDQLQQVLDSVELYLVSGDGARNGFLTNIVGNEVPGTMPNDSQLQAEYLAAGATVTSLDRIDTAAGEAARAAYELETDAAQVRGEALSISTDDSVVSLTVSSGDAEEAARLMDGIVDTLAAG